MQFKLPAFPPYFVLACLGLPFVYFFPLSPLSLLNAVPSPLGPGKIVLANSRLSNTMSQVAAPLDHKTGSNNNSVNEKQIVHHDEVNELSRVGSTQREDEVPDIGLKTWLALFALFVLK